MFSTPEREEIDHRTIKLVVGVIALSLAFLTGVFSDNSIKSISESYWTFNDLWYLGWAQSVFIGFLFAIAAFLLCYNGRRRIEMILAKLASLAAAGVALFPCSCGDPTRGMPAIHFTSATVMFAILAVFAYFFYRRAKDKPPTQAKVRAGLYALCCAVIVLSIAALLVDARTDILTSVDPRFTFHGEAAALIAFGVSWLLASRVLPGITHNSERFSPLRDQNPD